MNTHGSDRASRKETRFKFVKRAGFYDYTYLIHAPIVSPAGPFHNTFLQVQRRRIGGRVVRAQRRQQSPLYPPNLLVVPLPPTMRARRLLVFTTILYLSGFSFIGDTISRSYRLQPYSTTIRLLSRTLRRYTAVRLWVPSA